MRNRQRKWTSTPTLLILTLSRMTLSKVSFSDILGNEYWELGSFCTFGFYTSKNDTFESVKVDAHAQSTQNQNPKENGLNWQSGKSICPK